MDVSTLVAEAQAHGVQLRIEGRRLIATPAGRLPASLKQQLSHHRKGVAVVLAAIQIDQADADQSPDCRLAIPLTPEEEREAVRMGDYLERLYQEAAETRLRCSSGLQGARERDERMRAARARLQARLPGLSLEVAPEDSNAPNRSSETTGNGEHTQDRE